MVNEIRYLRFNTQAEVFYQVIKHVLRVFQMALNTRDHPYTRAVLTNPDCKKTIPSRKVV